MLNIIRWGLRILLFVAIVESNVEPLFRHCCALGKNKSFEPSKCESKTRTPIAGIPVEQTSICLSAIDICCVQQIRDNSCESGKLTAKQNGGVCNIQSKLDDEVTYKYCCESCKLGLITGSMALDCKSTNFRFGHPWEAVYELCCEESAAPSVAPTVNVTTREPQNICNLLPGELCAQICVPVGGSYRCHCKPGFTLMADSKSCQQDNVENRCDKYNNCDQNCFDNGQSIECSCNPGFELLADNKSCVDVNECNLKLDNCYVYGKVCHNTEGGYECVQTSGVSSTKDGQKKPPVIVVPAISCQAGYKYDVSANSCIDVDECKERIHVCVAETEACVNLLGGYRCMLKEEQSPPPSPNRKCPFGSLFDAQKSACVDIDECEQNRPCESNEICENLAGGFNCKCQIGFQRDNVTGACVDVNECQHSMHNCDGSQRCDNTVGSFQCIRLSGCGTGYTLNSQTGVCDDDDECALGTDDCKLLGPSWECRNMMGSFRCEKKRCDVNANCTKVTKVECAQGYENINGICKDINECKRKYACRTGQTCLNTPGSYRCVSQLTCIPGLRPNNLQTYCVDVDECAEQLGICEHKCINTWSTFRCACNNGFALHQDNRSCIDINECELFKDRRLCLGTCVNVPGSYKCQCPEGYRLGTDGATCQDIDECATENKCTEADGICLNMRGSYRCNTITCPANYIRDQDHKNRCVRASNYCLMNTGECLQMPLSYSFNYITFVSNVLLPTNGVQDLFHMRGPTSAITAAEFYLDLKKVQAPLGVAKVTRDFFVLTPVSAKQVVVSLVRSIQGPQDVELDLKMHVSFNGIFTGFTVSKLFIYVSNNPEYLIYVTLKMSLDKPNTPLRWSDMEYYYGELRTSDNDLLVFRFSENMLIRYGKNLGRTVHTQLIILDKLPEYLRDTVDWFIGKARRRDKELCADEPKLYLEESVLENKLPDITFRTLIELPSGLDYNEWLASHTIAIFDNVNLMYGTISEFCTATGCPDMVGPGLRTYLWFDDKGKKTRVSAPQYVDYVMTFTQKTINDEAVFPTKYPHEFPSSFETIVRKILRLLFHVLAHLYHSHFREMVMLSLHTHLNSVFTHLIILNDCYHLIDDRELEILFDLVNALKILELNDGSSAASKATTSTSSATVSVTVASTDTACRSVTNGCVATDSSSVLATSADAKQGVGGSGVCVERPNTPAKSSEVPFASYTDPTSMLPATTNNVSNTSATSTTTEVLTSPLNF